MQKNFEHFGVFGQVILDNKVLNQSSCANDFRWLDKSNGFYRICLSAHFLITPFYQYLKFDKKQFLCYSFNIKNLFQIHHYKKIRDKTPNFI